LVSLCVFVQRKLSIPRAPLHSFADQKGGVRQRDESGHQFLNFGFVNYGFTDASSLPFEYRDVILLDNRQRLISFNPDLVSISGKQTPMTSTVTVAISPPIRRPTSRTMVTFLSMTTRSPHSLSQNVRKSSGSHMTLRARALSSSTSPALWRRTSLHTRWPTLP
jgi:hypothetical protein